MEKVGKGEREGRVGRSNKTQSRRGREREEEKSKEKNVAKFGAICSATVFQAQKYISILRNVTDHVIL